jgi:hypothetical protein
MDREEEQVGHGRYMRHWIVLQREGTRMLRSGAARMNAPQGRGTGSREQRGGPIRMMRSMQDRIGMSAKRAGRQGAGTTKADKNVSWGRRRAEHGVDCT